MTATFKIESTRNLTDALDFAARSNEYDATKEVEVQTDKVVGKLVPCRSCKAPLVVNAFYAPARASCTGCNLPRQHAALLGGAGAGSATIVTDALLAETAERYPDCRCTEPGVGLMDGMPASSLWHLEAGCTGGVHYTPGYVCPRLNEVRRRVGR